MPMNATRGRDYQRFLKRLRAARVAAGLTQVEAARRLRTTQAFISKSESGDRRVDAGEIVRFAKLYGCRPADFFEA